MQQPHTELPSTRIITELASWDAIGRAWDDLYASSPSASTPLDRGWLRLWWEIYGGTYGRDGLRIVTVWRGPVLVAALPLYLGRGRGGAFGARELRFLSTGEAEYEETCADYLNLLYRSGEEAASLDAVSAAIGAMAWQRLELCDLPADSILVSSLARDLGDARVQIRDHDACVIANLDHGFEAYLSGLSSKTRSRARQELRKVEQCGAVFELADTSSAEGYFSDLVRLHQQRWVADGEPGCFAAARFTEFHRRLVAQWTPSGRAVLARLSLDGKPLAVLYGFKAGHGFELYQLGVDRSSTGAIHSPGTAANLLLMSQLAATGVTRYDLLRGRSSYKRSFATIEQPLVSLVASRRGPRTALSDVLDGAGHTWRGVRRRMAGEAS